METTVSKNGECRSDNIPMVSVVDDDVSVRDALQRLIRCAGWQPRVFSSAWEFLAGPRALIPGCLILNLTLPNLDGLKLQKFIADRTEMPIIFIAGHIDVSTTVEAMKAGALEVITKPFRDDVMANAIGAAIEHSRIAVRREAQLQVLRARYALLSPREREVMALVTRGLPNKLVGAELGISDITVKVHRARMMRKLQAQSLAELMNMATRLSLAAAPSDQCEVRRAVVSHLAPHVRGRLTLPATFGRSAFGRERQAS
jgi:FixJ family two-component response regulator